MRTAPFPTADALVNPGKGYIATQVLVDWATARAGEMDSTAKRLRTVSVPADTAAAIGVTAIPMGSLAGGLYRVSWYARITRAATGSSSLTVTIGWVESGVVLTASGAAMTGNTTGTVQSESVLVRIDAGSPITYLTAYTSSGATAMQYRLDLVAEQVDA